MDTFGLLCIATKIFHYFIQDEQLSVQAAREVLLELGRDPAFFGENDEGQKKKVRLAAVRSTLRVEVSALEITNEEEQRSIEHQLVRRSRVHKLLDATLRIAESSHSICHSSVRQVVDMNWCMYTVSQTKENRKGTSLMAKADTMLAILWLLHARGKISAGELAEELEVNIRTVYRCIDALCASGVPVVADIGRNGGYYLPDNAKLNPLFFNAQEQKSLLHAAQFARKSGYPYEDALEQTVTKLKRYTNPDQLKQLEHQEASLEVVHPPVDSKLTTMLAQIESSIDLQASLTLEYKKDYDGDRIERTLDPYGMVHWKNKWYVVGYCHLREELRTFRVDRINRCTQLDNRFRRPAGFSAREFLLSHLLSEPGAENRPDLITVHIKGIPQAIDDVCTHWLFGQALLDRSADQAHFRINELQLYTYAAYYLLSFGGKLRIMAPEDFKEHMVEITSSLLEHYSNSQH